MSLILRVLVFGCGYRPAGVGAGQGKQVTVEDVGDVLLAMTAKPEDATVQVTGCQALRDALVRPGPNTSLGRCCRLWTGSRWLALVESSLVTRFPRSLRNCLFVCLFYCVTAHAKSA